MPAIRRDDKTSSKGNSENGRTAWSLGAIKERNLALEGYCQTEGCGHFYVFNVDNLILGLGAGEPFGIGFARESPMSRRTKY
jgi:hypothetical protein